MMRRSQTERNQFLGCLLRKWHRTRGDDRYIVAWAIRCHMGFRVEDDVLARAHQHVVWNLQPRSCKRAIKTILERSRIGA